MTTRTEYWPSENEPASVAVVRAIADAEGSNPGDLTDRLYDSIDPDALDRLFASPTGGPVRTGRVTFRFAGYRVEVQARGRIVVEPHRPEHTPAEVVP